MINETKLKLTSLFSLAVIGITFSMLLVSYFYLHQSILQGLKQDIIHDGKEEFHDYYNKVSMADFELIEEDEVLQVFDVEGTLIGQSLNSINFQLAVNMELVEQAFKNKDQFELRLYKKTDHLVYYFPLSDRHVGRIAEPILQLTAYEDNFLKMVLISLPGILFFSFLISRWLVNQAMLPITLAFRYQENFSSNVTHELHSPLTSLKGNLEVALRKERGIEDYQDTLHLSLEEVNRIINLLKDLRLLASSNFSPLQLQLKPVDLKHEIQNVIDDHEPLMAERGLKFSLNELEGLTGTYDQILIHRALVNLINNAVKYTTDHGFIHLIGSKEQHHNVICIENSSDTLKPQEISQITDPFFRASNSTMAQGKGLGLNIVNYIIHSHNGSMKITMKEGGIFSLRLSLPDDK